MRFSITLTAAMLLTAAPALAKEKQQVTVSYVLAPARPLPAGLKAVAVIDSGVMTQGAKEDQREKKWSTMAADMIESMVANSNARFGSGIKVAQRRLTAQILKEQDLKLAGLVEGDAATRAGKLLDVQGLITSRITINIDVQKATKSTIDWGSILGAAAGSMLNKNRDRRVYVPAPQPRAYTRDPRYIPRSSRQRRYLYDPRTGAMYAAPGPARVAPPQPAPPPAFRSGGAHFGTREVEEVSRHLTVQCSFSLVDAVNGAGIVQYSPPPYRKQDTTSPDFLFGSLMKEDELDPVDHYIGELVERATQEFVAMIVPTEVEYTYTVVGRHSPGEAGVRALRAEDYETAYQHFLAEHRKYSDEHEAVFALGVISELLGDPQRALNYYRQAAGMEDVDEDELRVYAAARKRLADHLGRIVKPPPAGAESAVSIPAPQPTSPSPPDGDEDLKGLR